MTAAELRALIARATPGEWSSDFDDSALCVRDFQVARVYWHNQGNKSANAALIVALRNNAERFAELLEAEEAKTNIAWVHDPQFNDPSDHNAVMNGEVVGWVWDCGNQDPNTRWFGRFCDNSDGSFHPTEAEARAAVEAAVRAGR